MKHRRTLILTLALVALLGAPGCYTRVTKARGIGSEFSHPERYESSEPVIDRWIDDATGNNR